jgi:hypothetical protein
MYGFDSIINIKYYLDELQLQRVKVNMLRDISMYIISCTLHLLISL